MGCSINPKEVAIVHITPETLDHICALAQLTLTESERQPMAAELEGIVAYMDLLSRLPADDTHATPPVSRNVLRADLTSPSFDRADLLTNAPSTDGQTVLVPKTVE